jgi:hypothetical protein
VIEILSAEAAGPRIVLTLVLCALPVLAAAATEGHVPLGRAGVSIDRRSLLRADSTTGSFKDALTRLTFQ